MSERILAFINAHKYRSFMPLGAAEEMVMDIDISGINKAQLLATLYNNARPQGLGVLHARPAT